MEFVQRNLRKPAKLGILAGGFNPPTIAHVELAYAAGFYVDDVLCVLPRTFPHKQYFGATLEQRIEMLYTLDFLPPPSIATSAHGLFIDIARECREHYPAGTELCFVCGRDAAERILNWDYGKPGVVDAMLQDFQLLVASRVGDFDVPAKFKDRIHTLGLRDGHDQVSSTDVRERIARGEPWEHLVPDTIVDLVRRIYS